MLPEVNDTEEEVEESTLGLQPNVYAEYENGTSAAWQAENNRIKLRSILLSVSGFIWWLVSFRLRLSLPFSKKKKKCNGKKHNLFLYPPYPNRAQKLFLVPHGVKCCFYFRHLSTNCLGDGLGVSEWWDVDVVDAMSLPPPLRQGFLLWSSACPACHTAAMCSQRTTTSCPHFFQVKLHLWENLLYTITSTAQRW